MGHTRSTIFVDQTMNAVQILCPAKLTLSLKVKGRRRDGYHLIDAEMVSVDLCDELIIAEVLDSLFDRQIRASKCPSAITTSSTRH